MTDQLDTAHAYEAPRIEERTKIDLPLVLAAASGNTDFDTSAVFRSI